MSVEIGKNRVTLYGQPRGEARPGIQPYLTITVENGDVAVCYGDLPLETDGNDLVAFSAALRRLVDKEGG